MTHCPCGSPPQLRGQLGVDALAHEWPKSLYMLSRMYCCSLPSREDQERGSDSSPGGPQMAQENLVFEPLPAAAGPALGDPAVHGSTQPGERHPLAPRTGQTPAVGLAPERDRLSALGLSDTVVSTLQKARASSTRELYAYKWKYFQNWCMAEGHDPVYCPIAVILQFLQDLLEAGKSPSTLKVYKQPYLLAMFPLTQYPRALIFRRPVF